MRVIRKFERATVQICQNNRRCHTLSRMTRSESRERRLGPKLYPTWVNIIVHISGRAFCKIFVFAFPTIDKGISSCHAYTSVRFCCFNEVRFYRFDGNSGEVVRMSRRRERFGRVITPPSGDFFFLSCQNFVFIIHFYKLSIIRRSRIG